MAEIQISVWVKPGAKRTFVGGTQGDALVVSVTARAVEGAANEAVLRAIAEAFSLKRSAVEIASGETGRSKIIRLTADPGAIAATLAILKASPTKEVS